MLMVKKNVDVPDTAEQSDHQKIIMIAQHVNFMIVA